MFTCETQISALEKQQIIVNYLREQTAAFGTPKTVDSAPKDQLEMMLRFEEQKLEDLNK